MMNFDEISTAILTGSDAYDIYVTSLSRPDYNALYRKGYLQPLEDGEIALWTAGVYPEMAKAFTRHGRLCVSYPSSVHPDALTSTKTIHNGSRRSNRSSGAVSSRITLFFFRPATRPPNARPYIAASARKTAMGGRSAREISGRPPTWAAS